ncbi:hypothetical protein CWI35_11725 [[Bacillus] caldolyticus]|uniref:DUF1360 domain-containing protein n=1 Tax=Bacillus caldolyticus TaxID=1394 RepID=A0ABM6QP02_BACCL|nr:DUF1360 domain-containing protein [[Bacillus] caldolyticus]AUI37086.1 hypothetical protein CWI35_11725 [[Bacillus] caldolyticus]
MLRELDWMTYIMIILASYRFTHLIVFDKITEFIRNPFMKKEKIQHEDGSTEIKKVPKSKFGYLLNCYWCAGVWSAMFLALGYLFIPKIAMPFIFIFSIAGAQAILETFVGVGTKAIDLLSAAKKRMD